MPSDGLFLMMLRPVGLLILASGIAIPFLIWKLILGHTFTRIGFKPLAIGYILATSGLLVFIFITCYFDFSTRVSKQMLSEAERWSYIPGWTFYLSVLSLLFVMPILGFIAVPVCAWMLRLNRFSIFNISCLIITGWISMALIFWFMPSNEWEQTHRLQSFISWIGNIFLGFLCIGVPFIFGIYSISGRRDIETIHT